VNVPTIWATPLARMTIWAFGGYALWQGAGIIAGGPERWAGPSFAVLRRIPEATLVWGSLLVACGALILLGSLLRRWWIKAIGLAGLAVWSGTFAAGALQAARDSHMVANTGGKTYCLIALVAILLIFIDERRLLIGTDWGPRNSGGR
jgi:uncharacterized membrane protein YgdD (TMEM256/DUF423 family)